LLGAERLLAETNEVFGELRLIEIEQINHQLRLNYLSKKLLTEEVSDFNRSIFC
jgi:hypothetical protein